MGILVGCIVQKLSSTQNPQALIAIKAATPDSPLASTWEGTDYADYQGVTTDENNDVVELYVFSVGDDSVGDEHDDDSYTNPPPSQQLLGRCQPAAAPRCHWCAPCLAKAVALLQRPAWAPIIPHSMHPAGTAVAWQQLASRVAQRGVYIAQPDQSVGDAESTESPS